MTYRAFISTMTCGEGDFIECVKSIQCQRGIEIEHHVIYNHNELDAHQKQIKAWLSQRDRFDFFIKVDGDTVLGMNDCLAQALDAIVLNDASAAQIRLLDYYTNTLISGLNIYTKETQFTIPSDDLFCDRSVVHRKLIHSDSGCFDTKLVPIGRHCFHSTEKQAFHFGVHRGLKHRYVERDQVQTAFNCVHDRIRLFALKGFELSSLFEKNRSYNYNDAFFDKIFKDVMKEMNDE